MLVAVYQVIPIIQDRYIVVKHWGETICCRTGSETLRKMHCACVLQQRILQCCQQWLACYMGLVCNMIRNAPVVWAHM